MEYISDQYLERYHLGMRVQETELATGEEHLLYCPYCAERAEEVGEYVDAIRAAIIAGNFDIQNRTSAYHMNYAPKRCSSGGAGRSAMAPFGRVSLSARQREVLDLLGYGKTSKEIASLLNVAVETIGAHRKSLCRKLSVHSTAELVHYATQNLNRR